jgi:hypothetical protein
MNPKDGFSIQQSLARTLIAYHRRLRSAPFNHTQVVPAGCRYSRFVVWRLPEISAEARPLVERIDRAEIDDACSGGGKDKEAYDGK